MENYQTVTPELIVEETLDGLPVDTLDGTLHTDTGKKNARRSQATAVTSHRRADRYIWGIYICLMIVSIIEVFSASATRVSDTNVYSPLIDHGKFLVIGFLIVLGCQKLHYKWYRKYALPLLILSMGALLYATVFGASYNDAKRAIPIFGMTIQPPEIAKLTVALFLAKVLATNQRPGGVNNRGIIICAITVVIFAGALWLNGLTNALMVMGVSGAMFIIGGIEWRKLGYIVVIYSVCGGLLFAVKYAGKDSDKASDETEMVTGKDSEATRDRSETHMNRIKQYLHGIQPGDSVTNENRQAKYALYAIAHGGVSGQKPGNSRESARLPLAYSDYIYAIVVEDTGFIGGITLLALYLCLLARAGRVASKCRRAFPALLIMGCAVMIVLQALVHMCIVVGIGPVSGQPLPFISKGGTSIMVMSAAIGMMLSVSRYAVTTNNKKEINAELRELPEDLHSDNPSMLPAKS